jgi:hypothetical protein
VIFDQHVIEALRPMVAQAMSENRPLAEQAWLGTVAALLSERDLFMYYLTHVAKVEPGEVKAQILAHMQQAGVTTIEPPGVPPVLGGDRASNGTAGV